jgi:hypothetical protein
MTRLRTNLSPQPQMASHDVAGEIGCRARFWEFSGVQILAARVPGGAARVETGAARVQTGGAGVETLGARVQTGAASVQMLAARVEGSGADV